MSSRTWIGIALVVVAVLAAVWLATRTSAPPAPAPRVARVEATATPPAEDEPADAEATDVPGPPRPTRTPSAQRPYASATIVDGLDPVQTDRAPKVGKSEGPDSKNPRLITFPATSTVEAPNPVTVYGYLAEDDERRNDRGRKYVAADSRRVPARDVRGELKAADGTSLTELRFHDDGKDGDAEAGDYLFTAQFEPTPETALDAAGRLTVVVNATSPNGDQRTATTEVLYSVPAARLTGNYREELVDGHLRVLAEAKVEEPGTFELEATIADNDAKFIGWAYNDVQLDPGTHWIPLTYSGSIFRTHGKPGPYLVWSLALSTISKNPPERNDVIPNAIRTKPYTLDQFSTRAFE